MIQLQPAFIAQLEQARSEGRNEGEAKGEVKGQARMLLGLLQKRLGACPEEAIEQIYNLNSSGLEALSDVFLGLADMAALQQWLTEVSPTWQKAENS
jgi:flagellar biosynthesis/type III secretory pathway protein FliH